LHKEFFVALNLVLVERLQNELSRKNWTASELADRAKINRSTMSRILAGKVPGVSLDTIEKLAKALRIPPATLIIAN
jgi:transcriptional regulator with XRE-family HTH domain